MNAIVDIGNSQIKIAYFNDRQLLHQEVKAWPIATPLKTNNTENIFVGSVGKIDIVGLERFFNSHNFHFLDLKKLNLTGQDYPLQSLGQDRIANVCQALAMYPKKASLIVDAGTCITYDIVSPDRVFLSGGISPGVRLRLNAMHHNTAHLPSIDVHPIKLEPWAKNTEESMKRATWRGVAAEIADQIDHFLVQFPKGNIVLTGGDSKELQKLIKKPIFADSNWTLKGFNEILLNQI